MASYDNDDDIWTFGSNGRNQTAQATPTLRISQIDDVEPLDAQLGVGQPKAVPDVLRDVLFGQPDLMETDIATSSDEITTQPILKTYAILDAAKVTNLPEMLDASGLEHRCLFKGAAYDEMKNVAPWIVRLEDGESFTRSLFTRSDAPWHMWDFEPGVYLRSDGTLDQMWKHFRKFTRIQDQQGKWFYFRFWETGVLYALARQGDMVLLERIVAEPVKALLSMTADKTTWISLSGSALMRNHTSKLSLDENAWIAMSQNAYEKFMADLRQDCLTNPGSTPAHVDFILARLKEEGFRSRTALKKMALWWSTTEGWRVATTRWATLELEASRGMPDLLRVMRLLNLSEKHESSVLLNEA